MSDKMECMDCVMRDVCKDSKISYLFFLIGVIATVAMRIIEPLRFIDPLYAKIAWYVGVAGFFLFFVYKYRQSKQRSKVIAEYDLKGKLARSEDLSLKDEKVLMRLLCSQDNRKERINFYIIFLLSFLALLTSIVFEIL